MFKNFLIALSLLVLASTCAAATEREYQEPFCLQLGGEAEHVLPDRTRVDCLTATHAIEVDFARKWAEAIGQSLHYARMTGRAPGVVLIMDPDQDQRYLTRLYQIIDHWHLPIQVWVLKEEE